MNSIHVLGVSPDLHEVTAFIEGKSFALCIAPEKYHAVLQNHVRCHSITPLDDALELCRSTAGEILVIASGDPLYHGIGATLLRHFPANQLSFTPAISSLQRAASLCKMPWHDCALISLHGRKQWHLAGQLLGQRRAFLLTDHHNTPQRIAAEICTYLHSIGAGDILPQLQMSVAQNLGMVDERLFQGSLGEIIQADFAPLNVVIFENSNPCHSFPLGLRVEEIEHSRGLITKNEVRAAALHALRLPRQGVFWDIGAGSGSVSLEAARLAPELTIYAVEKNPIELQNIRTNIKKFACYNIIPVPGRAHEVLAELPAPDRIFVGGSGGEMEDIIKTAANRLQPHGHIVINSVLEKSSMLAQFALRMNGFTSRSSTVSVTAIACDGSDTVYNPITITTGERA